MLPCVDLLMRLAAGEFGAETEFVDRGHGWLASHDL